MRLFFPNRSSKFLGKAINEDFGLANFKTEAIDESGSGVSVNKDGGRPFFALGEILKISSIYSAIFDLIVHVISFSLFCCSNQGIWILDSKLQPIQAKFDDLVKQMNDNYTDLYYGMKLERFKILTLYSFKRELSLHFINFYFVFLLIAIFWYFWHFSFFTVIFFILHTCLRTICSVIYFLKCVKCKM